MAKKQALKSAGNRWLWQCATAFQCARLHESFKLLLVLCSSGFDVLGTSGLTVSTLRTSLAVQECPQIELRVNWRTLC